MKKSMKITLLVIASLTVITSIAAIVMLTAVSGNDLFYKNSTLGYIYALSYRWVCLASVILILFLLAIKNQKEVASMLANFKGNFIKTAKPVDALINTDSSTTIVFANKLLCKKCGKQMSIKSKFCPFCGESVINEKKEEVTETSEAVDVKEEETNI